MAFGKQDCVLRHFNAIHLRVHTCALRSGLPRCPNAQQPRSLKKQNALDWTNRSQLGDEGNVFMTIIMFPAPQVSLE